MFVEKTDIVKHLIQSMVKSNQDIIGEQCIKNDYDGLTVNDEDKKIAWNSYRKLFWHRTCMV